MTFASVTPAFAMSSESVGKSGNISEIAATSARENVNVQDAIALAQKVKPFVTYVNGKPVLTTRDAKKIGISEKDLKDIEEGMNFFSSHVTITAVGTAHKQGDVSAEITWWKDQDGIYIQFSPTDIKIGLTVGVLAGIILGLDGTVYTDSKRFGLHTSTINRIHTHEINFAPRAGLSFLK